MIAMFMVEVRSRASIGMNMNRTVDRQAEGRRLAPLVIICVAIGLIFLPLAFGLSARIDLGTVAVGPF